MTPLDKIYVAGHTGLVGSAIVRKLRSEGYDNLVLRSHVELDLTDQLSVRTFFEEERPGYVFLAAARVGGILANDSRPADFIRDNLLIESNVIDAAWRSGVKKLLFLGSSCIYPRLAPQPMKEEHLLSGPLEPTNQWYAVAKIAGIKMCQAYRKQYGFNAVSAMPTNLYGPGDNFDLENSHVLPALIRKFHLARLASTGEAEGVLADESVFGPIPEPLRSRLLETVSRVPPEIAGRTASDHVSSHSPIHPFTHSPVLLWGTGTPRREFLHVDDLAGACLFLMQNYDSEEIVNVGVGEDLSIKELAGIVSEVVGFEGGVAFDSSKPDGTPRKLLDVSVINSLGWRPAIGLREGIRQTYEWYVQRARQLATDPHRNTLTT